MITIRHKHGDAHLANIARLATRATVTADGRKLPPLTIERGDGGSGQNAAEKRLRTVRGRAT
jgi:hypothetical protein